MYRIEYLSRNGIIIMKGGNPATIELAESIMNDVVLHPGESVLVIHTTGYVVWEKHYNDND